MVGEPWPIQRGFRQTSAQRAAQETKMALVGEGADELFGGYPTYIGARIAERFVQLPNWLRLPFAAWWKRFPPARKKVTISFLLKRFVQGASWNGMMRTPALGSSITPALLRRLGVAPIDFR